MTAAEANEVIRVLADDKQTPPPSQSSTERYAAKLFLRTVKKVKSTKKARWGYVLSVKIFS